MKEFSSYYYAKEKDTPQTYYADIGYFEPAKVTVKCLNQKSISLQEASCKLPKKPTVENSYE